MQQQTVGVRVAVAVIYAAVFVIHVIYVAVSAHLAVVPVHAAVPVLNVATTLELVDLKAPWTGNIQSLY